MSPGDTRQPRPPGSGTKNPGPIDLIVFRGSIVPYASSPDRAQALAVSGGRIAAVGTDQEIVRLRDRNTTLIDLDGKVVLPGLIDAHVHALQTGLIDSTAALGSARSIPEASGLLRRHAETVTPGHWVLGLGCRVRELAEQRLPTRLELDQVSERHPVYVDTDTGHKGAVNTAGLRLIGLDATTFGVATGPDGEPTGVLESDTASFTGIGTVLSAMSDAEMDGAYRATAAAAVRRGVTTIHCLEGLFVQGDRDVDALLRVAGSLPLHTVLYYQTMDVERVVAMGLPRIGGCLCVDGAIFEQTALFYEPYVGGSDNRGHLYYSEQQVEDFVLRAHEAGLQVAMHAIGDRAIDIVVDAYHKAHRRFPVDDMRHRVEHFVCPTPLARDRARELALGIVMQPASTAAWDQPGCSSYERFLGESRAADSEPLGQCLHDGVRIAGSSDSPVLPIDPLAGIDAVVNDPRPARRCSPHEALSLFTEHAAWVAHEESERGSLIAGKAADFVVLDGDPLLAPGRILDAEVVMTFAEGRLVFSR
jgi:predicted amidohydrolase YtcJ